MKNKTLLALIIAFSIVLGSAASVPQRKEEKAAKNSGLTKAEKKAGWKLLFDGKSFNGWRGLGRDHIPEGLWVVQDGAIRKILSSDVKSLPDGRPVENGDIMTTETYENFELYFEWKVFKGGNSGLKYNVSEEMCRNNNSPYSALGFEYQMLDDDDPMYASLKPAQFSGSLYDLIPAKRGFVKPDGEYNSSRILVNGNHVEHWLNGTKVVEYEFGSKELEDAFQASKFKKIEGFQNKRKAHIVLQNHSDEAWFRNIKIRVL